MGKYEDALAGLNTAQRQAVTTTEGPVLVIAGPGTGKTQLLTTRIAHILATTDTLPQNILCLTFTESAASTMRARLANMVGQAAYKVTISTYHAFGSELIRQFPDYFLELSDMQPADELATDRILREIVDKLPYGNPLKFADNYLGDVKTLVSDAKRALLTPDNLRAVAAANTAFLAAAQPIVREALRGHTRVSLKDAPRFVHLGAELAKLDAPQPIASVQPIAKLLLNELSNALQATHETGKATSISGWKKTWLAKDTNGDFIIDGQRHAEKLSAVAGVYEAYLRELQAEKLFDYDDMILRGVRALEDHADLRFTLQEQYLYLMLDEFQDTNGAQLRLVELLTDNPASEGRPNVLAVGDDDQAIYAFQGADYSHMLQFQRLYRDVLLVPLTQNYRSHADVLHLARGIAEQIEERLHHHFPQIEKTLTANNTSLPKRAIVERREAKSDVAQFAWVARRIRTLIDGGLPASEIAVLAPQHKHLEPLLAFLRAEDIPMHYEKRENVLDNPAINQLLRMSELCLSLSRSEQGTEANSLWAEVLSFDFWQLPTSLIWQLSWQASDDREEWTNVLFSHEQLRPIALFFVRLSRLVHTETLETLLDYLIGVEALDVQEPGQAAVRSPFYEYYFGEGVEAGKQTARAALEANTPAVEQPSASLGSFWDVLSSLTVLRTKLREHRSSDPEPLGLPDLVEFVAAHHAANIKILNTSPYQEADQAVQLMTAFKAKGMEFQAVFVLAVSDDVWGNAARGTGARLSLPQNLHFIRYAGATNDERLRLFYVAVTRAKTHLYLCNYTSDYAARPKARLSYLDETIEQNGTVLSPLLPASSQTVLGIETSDHPAPTTELAAYWQRRHEQSLTREALAHVLRARLDRFQLSPTHINTFTDLVHAGPSTFFMNTILRFPKAPSPYGQYGNAMHETLEWLNHFIRKHEILPNEAQLADTFARFMSTKRLSRAETSRLIARSRPILKAYLEQRGHTVLATNECEHNFRDEGIIIGDAHMGGKIDKLMIDTTAHELTIVDYKTGTSYTRWRHDVKLHKYRQQLYFYKMLVEQSHTFSHLRVADAYLEFVEPDEAGQIQELHLTFDSAETDRLKLLANAVWHCVQSLNMPDVSAYPKTIAGIEAFEQDLIDGAI